MEPIPKDNQKLKTMVSVIHYTAQVHLECKEKQSRYSDMLTSANPSRSFHFMYLGFKNLSTSISELIQGSD